MKRKDKNTVIKEKNEIIKGRTSNLDIHKSKYYHQHRAPVEKIVLFSNLKNSQTTEFNSFIKKGEVSLRVFLGAKSRQLNHHTIPLLEDNTYNAAAIHFGINNLLSNV